MTAGYHFGYSAARRIKLRSASTMRKQPDGGDRAGAAIALIGMIIVFRGRRISN
jgi:hypothetical protein